MLPTARRNWSTSLRVSASPRSTLASSFATSESQTAYRYAGVRQIGSRLNDSGTVASHSANPGGSEYLGMAASYADRDTLQPSFQRAPGRRHAASGLPQRYWQQPAARGSSPQPSATSPAAASSPQ